MPKLDQDALYSRFLLRDRADDGRYLAGVLSTGIYCLPSCPAKRPKRENVRFFRSPEEAAASGLRPCFRCRPDSFYRGEAFHETLYEQTAGRVRLKPGNFADIGAIGRAAGVSRTALNDLFRDHAHESPAAFLRRMRLEAVCRLIEQGVKPAEAAAEAGFGSASTFHEQFVAKTGMTPAAYAGLREKGEFRVQLPEDYRSRETLGFFGRDRESISERVLESGFEKCFEANGHAIEVAVHFGNGEAICRTDAGFAWHAHRAVVRMLGLESDTKSFERLAGDGAIAGLFRKQRGLRIPLTPTPWEALGWAIMGQQISLQVAVMLRRTLIQEFGQAHSNGLRAFPTASVVAEIDMADLRKMKFSASKAEYLIAAARAVANGEVPLDRMRQLSARHAARLLAGIRGVGPWTIQYVFLRGLGFADCLPAGDAGLARGLEGLTGTRPDEAGVREALDRFAPFRSLAACHVWASLNNETRKGTEG